MDSKPRARLGQGVRKGAEGSYVPSASTAHGATEALRGARPRLEKTNWKVPVSTPRRSLKCGPFMPVGISGLLLVLALGYAALLLSPTGYSWGNSIFRLVWSRLNKSGSQLREREVAYHSHVRFSPMFIHENFEHYPPVCSMARTAHVLAEGDWNGGILDYFWEEILGGNRADGDVIIPVPVKERGEYPIHCVRFTYSRRRSHHGNVKPLKAPVTGRLVSYDTGEMEPSDGAHSGGHLTTSSYDAIIFIGSGNEYPPTEDRRTGTFGLMESYWEMIQRRYALHKHIGFILKGSEHCQALKTTDPILFNETRAVFVQHVHELRYRNGNGESGEPDVFLQRGIVRFPLGPSTEIGFPASRRAFIGVYGHIHDHRREYDVVVVTSLGLTDGPIEECVESAAQFCRSGDYVCRMDHRSSAATIDQYATVLRDSKFVLCPPARNPETPCIFEAIIAGAIPVISTRRIANCNEDFSVWKSLGMPAIFLDDWGDLQKHLGRYLKDSVLMGRLREEMTSWYHRVFINHYRHHTVSHLVRDLGSDALASARKERSVTDAPVTQRKGDPGNRDQVLGLEGMRIRGSPTVQHR